MAITQTQVLRDLRAYQPVDEEDRERAEATARFVRDHPAFWDRAHGHGHVTASAWIMDRAGESVLLTHHAKLGRWLQLGGHVEGDSSLLAAAVREAREESGLESLVPVSENIFDVDVHFIPARGSEEAHVHYDIRFLLHAEKREGLRVSRESRALAWVGRDEVPALNPDLSLRRMLRKSFPPASGSAGAGE